jgi:uncharacterized membrane protein
MRSFFIVTAVKTSNLTRDPEYICRQIAGFLHVEAGGNTALQMGKYRGIISVFVNMFRVVRAILYGLSLSLSLYRNELLTQEVTTNSTCCTDLDHLDDAVLVTSLKIQGKPR